MTDSRTLRTRDALMAIAGTSITLSIGVAAGAGDPPQGPWRGIANIASEAPGTGQVFRSFNQPSVNRDGVAVFRARAAGPGQPIRGIYLRRMNMNGSPIETVVERGDAVPQPNNTQTPPDSGELASFLEFPSFPRIDADLEIVATRGQHEPVWTYEVGKGEETRVGTAGVYVAERGMLETGASLLGAVIEEGSGLPVFPEFSVPGMPEGTRFDQFPGAPSLDGGMLAFKGNFTDPASGLGKTGVFFRQVFDGPTQLTHRVASSDTLIPGQAKGGEVRFGSTASPSAAAGQLVFLGLDNEEAPTLGGIYLAPIAADPTLLPIVEIGGAVPGEDGALFTRLGEALAFDGRYISFWGAWGAETRTVVLECPTDGNPDLIAYCHEQHPDGFAVEIPVHQGVFVHDIVTAETFVAAATSDEPAGFTDFLYWVFSGRAPGSGHGGDDSDELARWRNSAFTAVVGREVPGAGEGQVSSFEVAFKGLRGELDGIYLSRDPAGTMIGALTTMMPGTLVDPDAPAGSRLVTLGLEREALRDDWFVVSASMLDDTTKESWAGVYVASITDILPCEGDLNGDALVDGADLSGLLGSWGPCPDCAGDLDGDGVVDGADVAVLLSRWGTCW